jgi:DNA-binding GntR family transcriptional regulator
LFQGVDHNSPIPAYYQIELDLKKRISQREWDVYQQLPSEMALTKYYNVSRVTLRQALAELEKDGLISRYRRKGSFINAKPIPFVHDLEYSLVLGERITRQGFSMTAEVLNQTLVEAPFPDIMDSMHLGAGDKVVFIERLFFLDDKAIAIGRSWLNAKTVPGLESKKLIDNSLSKSLDIYYSLRGAKVEDFLEVVRPTSLESELLQTALDTPLFVIKGISYLQNGLPLEYSNTCWSGDKVRFHFSLKLTEKGFVLDF